MSHSPCTADVHWEEGIRQGNFRGIGVIYKLVGKEDVIIYTVSEEHCEADHKQQLTAREKKVGERRDRNK